MKTLGCRRAAAFARMLPMLRPLLAILLLSACDPTDAPGTGTGPDSTQVPDVRLQEVVRGLVRPVYLTAPAGDSRLFIVEQPGRIRIVENGQLLPTPFLDLTSRVSSGGERGLLSVAFHPSYSANGLFYVNYTDTSGDTQIERYRVGPDRNQADPASAKRILAVDQPFANHNGGLIVFGPDGKLYIGMGDGGGGGDPQGHGQNPRTLLGTMLRIDVDAGDPYAVPADNPYAGRTDRRAEIWAIGLRNPWRFSFDREAGQLYLADVGQNQWEEINVVPSTQAGLNFGWNIMEGAHCFPSGDSCDRTGLVIPVLEYPRAEGQSVTGGYVYRGRAMPGLRGHYFYADFIQGWVRSFRLVNGQAVDRRVWDFGSIGNVSSFGEDSSGELYVVSYDGRILRMVP